MLALAVNTGGVLGKLFSEAVETIDAAARSRACAPPAPRGCRRSSGGCCRRSRPLWTSYALYRFESNARSATVLGLIGAGGIGQLLFESLQSFNFSETSAIVIVIVVAVTLIDLLSQAMRSRLM